MCVQEDRYCVTGPHHSQHLQGWCTDILKTFLGKVRVIRHAFCPNKPIESFSHHMPSTTGVCYEVAMSGKKPTRVHCCR